MNRWLHSATPLLFVVTEALAWFIVIGVIAATLDFSGLVALRDDIEHGGGGRVDDPRVQGALAVLQDSIDGLSSGPSLLVVLVAAFAAVFISRTITQLRLPGLAAALLGLFASVVALNVLLHIALAGDVAIWDSSGLAEFFDDPSTRLAAERDAETFVADPAAHDARAASLAMIVFSMFALWVRFLWVGRGTVHFERVLRSFSVGFPLVLIATLFARASGTTAALFALPYFVLSMLTLAVANAGRASERETELTRSAPWVVSALVTVGLLAAVALLFGMIALLEIERALTPLGTLLLRLLSWVMLILLTPVFWILEIVFNWLIGDRVPDQITQNLQVDSAAEAAQEAAEGNEGRIPGWVGDAFRLALFSVVGAGLFLLARRLFRHSDDEEDQGYEEERSAAQTNAGLGRLLRNLIPSRRQPPVVPPWLDRHAVYRLFARAVNDADDRGFHRRPGETPLEFAAVAASALDAPPLPDIAAEFDRARYGRHYPTDAELGPLDRSLGEWEQSHPATAELREAVARDIPEEEPPPPPPPEVPDPSAEMLPPDI